MTKTTNPRLGTSAWSADTDTWPGRVGINAELATINANAAVWGQGTTAARPIAAYSGRFYWATDTSRLWYDNGALWTEVSPVGGGGAPAAIDIGDAGVEGSSRIAARADHQHALVAPVTDPANNTFGGALTRGSSITAARSDHGHATPALPIAVTAPQYVSAGGVNAVGVSTSLARADHQHAALSMVFYVGAGAFTGATPENLGNYRWLGFTGTFGTDAAGFFTVLHTGVLNGTLSPHAESIDPNDLIGVIQPTRVYSSPGQTIFLALSREGAPRPNMFVTVSGGMWAW